ncbi:MAG TPA: glycosyltransferase family 2 protein [Stellaceae bacterium]|nr:glycosyltransferase family 2 protein [Stellaceae bacterium]
MTTFHVSQPLQKPFDAAVVIPTLCRPSLLRAAASVFQQVGVARLQVLIGIDVVQGDTSIIDAVLAARPPQHVVTVLNLGYSTSMRHGGVHLSADSGALRTILTYCANSRFVTYLDDDNWMHETHIQRLLAAIKDRDWAYTLRYFVDPDTQETIAVDRWESVGPGKGIYRDQTGGFVDPNCLMIDKLRCDAAIRFWAIPLPGDRRYLSADRAVFQMLRRFPSVGFTEAATVYYLMSTSDPDREMRVRVLRELRRRHGAAPLMSLEPLSAWGV